MVGATPLLVSLAIKCIPIEFTNKWFNFKRFLDEDTETKKDCFLKMFEWANDSKVGESYSKKDDGNDDYQPVDESDKIDGV
jgi:hypothetical protein